MKNLTFEVPPGLGDITWCYQKIAPLLKTGQEVTFKICADPPLRSTSFVDTLPGIINGGYGRSYVLTRKEILPYDTDLSTLESGTYSISLNPWLESGKHISKAYPAQKTEYHFPTFVTTEQCLRAQAIISVARDDTELPLIGFYCSSYAHRPDLGFWSVDEWVLFLTMISDMYPAGGVRFIALGAKYDDRTLEVYHAMIAKGFQVTSAIGNANVPVTKELISRLDYFFAFPSGLGIMADVVDTPCMMWYWSNLIKENEGFLNSYADPKNIESKRHINLPYLKVLHSVDYFEMHGKQHVGS